MNFFTADNHFILASMKIHGR